MSAPIDAARHAEWKIHNLEADMMLALEESGGELTPEVEALEAKIAENADALADAGVRLRAHAKAMAGVCKEEKRRIDDARRYWERVEGLAVRWLRIAAREKGERFEVGSFRVRLQAAPPRAVHGFLDGLPPEVESELCASGLGRFDFKPDLRAIASELKKGAEVPGYSLEYPEEKTVVVR